MKKREFNKLLKELSVKGLLSAEKIAALSSEKKNQIIHYLVKNRGPIVKNFIDSKTDMSWLHSMGYLYSRQGVNFQFLCTSENQNNIG